MKVIIVGGGWGGCAAALSACKQGTDVSLIERTDMLLGTGLVGGIMRNNGRFTANEELVAMSGGGISSEGGLLLDKGQYTGNIWNTFLDPDGDMFNPVFVFIGKVLPVMRASALFPCKCGNGNGPGS